MGSVRNDTAHSVLTMKVYFIFLFVMPIKAYSQISLDTSFLLPGTDLTTIAGVVVDSDTIVCIGNITDLNGTHGIHLSKYDSTGNLLTYKIIAEPGLINDVGETTGLIKTSDGGYAAVSGTNIGQNVLLIKFNHQGETQWVTEIARPDFGVIYADGLTECEDGYIVAGFGQLSNGLVSGFICKVGEIGNILWNNKYGHPTWNAAILKIIKKNDNSFWLGGGQSTIGSGCEALQLSQGRAWIFEIDSTGDVLYNWIGSITDSEGRTLINLDSDGKIIYSTSKVKYNINQGDTIQLKIRKINPGNNQTVWEHYQTPMILTCANSGWFGVERNPVDGGWDLVGSYQSYENGFVISGVCAHTNPEGETKWIRLDTIYTSPDIYIDQNKLYAIAHLSSGSIIAGGFVRKAEPFVHDEAWLIKYSIGGCVTALDCAMVSTKTSVIQPPKFEVYPNPFLNMLNIHILDAGRPKSLEFILMNTLGEIVVQKFLYDDTNEIKSQYFPPGIYFWGIRMKGMILKSGRIIKVND